MPKEITVLTDTELVGYVIRTAKRLGSLGQYVDSTPGSSSIVRELHEGQKELERRLKAQRKGRRS